MSLRAAAADALARGEYNFISLSGGKYYVRPEELREFFEIYSKSIEQGNTYYLCEKRESVFRLFFDIDILMTTDTIPDSLKWKNITMSITETLKKFYSPDVLRSVVMSAPGKEKGNLYFVSLHIVYPDLYIDTKTTLKLLPAIQQGLANDVPMPSSVVSKWDDKTIDVSPYTTTECFRILGSDKWVACITCKGNKKKSLACTNCNGTGGFPEIRPYSILDVLDSNGLSLTHLAVNGVPVDIIHLPFIEQLRVSSINPYNSEYVLYTGPVTSNTLAIETEEIPITTASSSSTVPSRNAASSRTTASTSNTVSSSGTPVTATRKRPQRDADAPLSKVLLPSHKCDTIKEFIVKEFSSEYADMQIKSLESIGQDMFLLVPYNEKYCMNISDWHTTQHVYFLITPYGVQQKCHCKCDKKSQFGITCMEWNDTDPDHRNLRTRVFTDSEFHQEVCHTFFRVRRTAKPAQDPPEKVQRTITKADALAYHMKRSDSVCDSRIKKDPTTHHKVGVPRVFSQLIAQRSKNQ